LLDPLVPGFHYLNGMTTYQDAALLIPKANFTRGARVYFDYYMRSTYDIWGDYTNFTVTDELGNVEIWVANTTLDYTAGISESGNFNFLTATLDIGTHYIFVIIEHEDITTTAFYTQFTVTSLAPDFCRLNVATYSDAATAIPCNNFTAWADVILNGTVQAYGDVANASIVISLYNESGYMSDLLDVIFNLTAGTEYNITELNGNILLYWTANASGRYYVRLNVTKPADFYNTTVTTEGFFIRANATAAATGVKPMIDLDFEPLVEIIYEQRQEILIGVTLMGILMLAYMTYDNRKHLKNRRWRIGKLEVRWGGGYRKARGN